LAVAAAVDLAAAGTSPVAAAAEMKTSLQITYNCKQAKYVLCCCLLHIAYGWINRNLQGPLRKGSIADLCPDAPIMKTNLLTDDSGFLLSIKE
jgi:hypothetical protein